LPIRAQRRREVKRLLEGGFKTSDGVNAQADENARHTRNYMCVFEKAGGAANQHKAGILRLILGWQG